MNFVLQAAVCCGRYVGDEGTALGIFRDDFARGVGIDCAAEGLAGMNGMRIG